MQQQQQQRVSGAVAGIATNSGQMQASKTANPVGGISISQPAQRYDYASMQQQQQMAANIGGQSASYDPSTYASNMSNAMIQQQQRAMQQQSNAPKWGQLPGQPGANQFNKKSGQNQFQNRRRNPTGASVQIFYCEVCKISCAGPQVIFSSCIIIINNDIKELFY
jgi:hypothetical protein